MTNQQLVNQDSGNTEWFTPPHIIYAAREVMGGIDLDPASCYVADLVINANRYYTKEQDGLTKSWQTTALWINHPFHKGEDPCPQPYSRCRKKICNDPEYSHYRGHHIDKRIPSNSDWINKLVYEYTQGRVFQACCICFAATSEDWFRPLLIYTQCFIHGRVNYVDLEGKPVKGVTKGSVVTYLGPNVARFAQVFSRLGTVKVAISPH